jgi:hypothetical protein
MRSLPAKFLKDIELFVKLKSDRNSLLEVVDKAYGDVCDEISSYLQDLMLNAWLDGKRPQPNFLEMAIVAPATAAETVDFFVEVLEAK